jgi:hypothetical protein
MCACEIIAVVAVVIITNVGIVAAIKDESDRIPHTSKDLWDSPGSPIMENVLEFMGVVISITNMRVTLTIKCQRSVPSYISIYIYSFTLPTYTVIMGIFKIVRVGRIKFSQVADVGVTLCVKGKGGVFTHSATALFSQRAIPVYCTPFSRRTAYPTIDGFYLPAVIKMRILEIPLCLIIIADVGVTLCVKGKGGILTILAIYCLYYPLSFSGMVS